MSDMKSVRHSKGLLHVETPLGMVNIRVGLVDCRGRRVDSIQVSAFNCTGDRKVKLSGGRSNTRLIELKTRRNS